VTANAADPGMARTNIGRNNTSPRAMALIAAHRAIAGPAEKGAQTQIYLASSPKVEGVTGRYFADSREVRSSPASYDGAAARRLWRVSEELIGLPVPVTTTGRP